MQLPHPSNRLSMIGVFIAVLGLVVAAIYSIRPTTSSIVVIDTAHPTSPGVTLTVTPTSPPTPTSVTVLLDEDFNDRNSDDWIPSIGSWDVVDGFYVCEAGDYAETVYGGGLWSDYAMNVRVEIISEPADVALIGRWQDSENFYMAQLLNGQAYLKRKEKGTFTVLANAPSKLFRRGWYNIHLEFVGTKINLFVDLMPILSVEDGAFMKGRLGLRCASDSPVYFDQVWVTLMR